MKRGYLAERFQYVRQHFFPRWDLKKRWKVRFIPNASFAGRCSDKNKEILVVRFTDQDDLDLLLIHEICHVRCGNHGEKWQNRMSEAARRAEELDRKVLAGKIMRDLKTLDGMPEVRAEHVYRAIEQLVSYNPSGSYRDTINYIAGEFGCTPRTFLKKYKRVRKTYDEAKKYHSKNNT